MAAEDIERIRFGFELFERGDLEAAMEYFDPDFELNDHIIPEDTTKGRGPEALVAQLENLSEVFDEVHYELREFVDLGDRVVVRVGVYARAQQTGIEFSQEVGQIWCVRGGLATRLDVFASWEEACQAAGVSEG
jgi:ketosteroid isomerase-like protein